MGSRGCQLSGRQNFTFVSQVSSDPEFQLSSSGCLLGHHHLPPSLSHHLPTFSPLTTLNPTWTPRLYLTPQWHLLLSIGAMSAWAAKPAAESQLFTTTTYLQPQSAPLTPPLQSCNKSSRGIVLSPFSITHVRISDGDAATHYKVATNPGEGSRQSPFSSTHVRSTLAMTTPAKEERLARGVPNQRHLITQVPWYHEKYTIYLLAETSYVLDVIRNSIQ